jgi:hypothetical protein
MARIRRVLGLARVVIGLLISVVSLIKLILSLVGGATNYSVRCSGPTITNSYSRRVHKSSSPPRWAGRWGQWCILRSADVGGHHTTSTTSVPAATLPR